MDTLSHAAWGYASVRFKGSRKASLGAIAGAAPDLFYFLPSKIDQIWQKGWSGLTVGREPGIWRADGPPLPPELVEAYHRYYVYTHSLVVLAAVALVFYLAGWRRWLWLILPPALHIVMDLPTHERYLTPIFYPISEWTIEGISWADPRIFWPNVTLLILTHLLLWRKYRGQEDHS